MAYQGKTIGLALSGGGFRATLFGLGSLLRLNELGLLQSLDRITSVSGGSILAGYLGLQWKSLSFSNGVATNFEDVIVRPMRAFCSTTIDIQAGILGILTPFRSAGDYLVSKYDKVLFKKATIRDLPIAPGRSQPSTGPEFILYATNLQTGRNFRFTRDYVADYFIGINNKAVYSLATAVGASSAFPPIFSPIEIKASPTDWSEPKLVGHPDLANLQSELQLGDGGIYDNIGMQALLGNVDVMLISDAGAPFRIERSIRGDYVSQLGRVRDILIDQTRALRKSNLMDDFNNNRRRGTYWGITTEIANYKIESIVKDSPTTAGLQRLPTRLSSFDDSDQGHLINWSYALCDAALRKHIDPQLNAATRQPVPSFAI
jgi:NTE family protein